MRQQERRRKMAIFNVTSFAADAEVLGKVRQVSFSELDGLTIGGLTLEQAKGILGKLATGLEAETLEGSVQHTYEAQPKEGDAQQAEQQAAEKPDTSKKEKPKTRPKQRARPKKDSESAPATEPAETNVVSLGAAKGEGGGSVADKLQKAARLMDVVAALRESGLATEEEIIAECERIKPDVACLKRIPNMADRVRRVLERMSA